MPVFGTNDADASFPVGAPGQLPLELPYWRVQRPSEAVILDVLRDLDIRRQSNETLLWRQWTAAFPYQRRLSEAIGVSVDRRFVWVPSG